MSKVTMFSLSQLINVKLYDMFIGSLKHFTLDQNTNNPVSLPQQDNRLHFQTSHGSLQWVRTPEIMAPTQEPACECWRFKALLHCNNGSSLVPIGRIRFNIFDR